MFRRLWLPAIVLLTILLSLLSTGCQDKKLGKVMVDYSDEQIQEGYESGFNDGASVGYGDGSAGAKYSPSLKTNLDEGYRYSIGYWRGFKEGYDYGWKTVENGGSEPEQNDWYSKAVEEATQGKEGHVVGYDQKGYADGYSLGKKEALADCKEGNRYSGNPSDNIINDFCKGESQSYKEGWIAGYKDGYRDNYNIEAYENGYDAGEKQALADKAEGRDFDGNPSDSAVASNCSGKSQDYREVWIAGYRDGYDEHWGTLFEGSLYKEGYETGLKNGREWGKSHREWGYEYDDSLGQESHGYGEEWERGYRDGYKKGYEEGYYGL